ncbi:MAG: MFS transporter, partial [Pseudorhodoplanes sp.]
MSQTAAGADAMRSAKTDLETSTIRAISWRLIPFLVLAYFLAYLDRVNLGFAALTMNAELNFSPTVFAWGAGIFFIGYFLFEVPSNIALEKFGASRWIARIMVSWGIISALMALVTGVWSFYGLRFLLGIAEAGFFPGIILYLTYWFPAEYRARFLAAFAIAVPVSTVIGAPISGMLLGLDGALGLKGWQWLFIIEGIPSIVLGVVTWFYLTDRPEKADWLSPEQKAWLSAKLDSERVAKESAHGLSLWQALASPRVLMLSVIYFGFVAALYGMQFWLPQIVKAFGLTNA